MMMMLNASMMMMMMMCKLLLCRNKQCRDLSQLLSFVISGSCFEPHRVRLGLFRVRFRDDE